MKSTKTTITGLAAALGLIIAWVLPMLGLDIDQGNMQELAGALTTVISLILHGKWSRDDNVSSEGTLAAKDVMKLLILLPVLSVGMFGCQHTTAMTARMAQAAYVGIVDTATVELQTGNMSMEQAQAFESIRREVRPMLDEWIRLEASGQNSQYDGIDRLIHLLDTMILIVKGSNHDTSATIGDCPRAGRAESLCGTDRSRGSRQWRDYAGTGCRPYFAYG